MHTYHQSSLHVDSANHGVIETFGDSVEGNVVHIGGIAMSSITWREITPSQTSNMVLGRDDHVKVN